MSVVPSQSVKNSLEEAVVECHANLKAGQAYLEGRGLTAETCKRFRLGVVPDWETRWPTGRLAVPYLSPAGVVDIKFRMLGDSEGPKYLYATGTEHRLFNVRALLERSSTYVLTEGELDALSVEQATGLPCVAYPGANAWKSYFGRAFYGCAEVVVLSDGDEPGRAAARVVVKEVGKYADVCRLVDLPSGMDANSILVNQGEGALKDVIGV